MSEMPLALERLRAAVNGDDFEWEVDGGSPFDDVKALLEAYDDLRTQLARAREALKEISEGKGAFSRDPFQHAQNCIEDMKQLALDALADEKST